MADGLDPVAVGIPEEAHNGMRYNRTAARTVVGAAGGDAGVPESPDVSIGKAGPKACYPVIFAASYFDFAASCFVRWPASNSASAMTNCRDD
jgi:hypothetical protein